MTFDPNIPQDLPSPSDIVSAIKTNFSQYASIFGTNHLPINNSNQGKHGNVIFENQVTDPVITNSYDAFYAKSVTSASGTSSQLFLKIPSFLPNPNLQLPVQLTFNTVNTTGPNYQSFMAGGYIIFFGKKVNPGTINLSPTPSAILCAIANTNNFTPAGLVLFPFNVSVTILSPSSFSINSTFATSNFNWIVVAKQ